MPKQVKPTDRLLNAIVRVRHTDAITDREIAYMPTSFIKATMPHSDPGDVETWVRRNGAHTLTIQPFTTENESGRTVRSGIPYGSIPRIVLAWLSGEALRNQSRTVQLGESLSDFLTALGYNSTGGAKGDMTRVKEQIKRLFLSRFTIHTTENGKISFTSTCLVDRGALFWDDISYRSSRREWEGFVELSQVVYDAFNQSCVPLDWRIIREIKNSPLSLDLYFWLTHKNYSLRRQVTVKWKDLHQQLGCNYKQLTHFRESCRNSFQKISPFWPGLKLDASGAVAIKLAPSPVLIADRVV